MSDNTNSLSIGQDVWWSDPNDKNSGSYVVLEIKYDPDGGLYDDTPILISNGVSEHEVEAWELQSLALRRKRIKELVDRVTEIVEKDDWSVDNLDENYDNIDLHFSKYSSHGQDFGFYIDYDSGDIDGFISSIEAYYKSYDPSEKASIWIGDDGHGKNGAPYDIQDLLDDMKECKENIKSLIDLLKQELKGVKIPKPITYRRYSEQLYNIRTEVKEAIKATLRDICNHLNVNSLLWWVITDKRDPEVSSETDSGFREVTPLSIGLDNKDGDDFIITFTPESHHPKTINGETFLTADLIDILKYLET